MDELLRSLLRPDNIPVAAMVVAIAGLLWVWLRQARRHDRLIREGRRDDVVREMRR